MENMENIICEMKDASFSGVWAEILKTKKPPEFSGGVNGKTEI